MEEPYVSIVKQWASIRRHGHALADELISSARRMEQQAQGAANRYGRQH